MCYGIVVRVFLSELPLRFSCMREFNKNAKCDILREITFTQMQLHHHHLTSITLKARATESSQLDRRNVV